MINFLYMLLRLFTRRRRINLGRRRATTKGRWQRLAPFQELDLAHHQIIVSVISTAGGCGPWPRCGSGLSGFLGRKRILLGRTFLPASGRGGRSVVVGGRRWMPRAAARGLRSHSRRNQTIVMGIVVIKQVLRVENSNSCHSSCLYRGITEGLRYENKNK